MKTKIKNIVIACALVAVIAVGGVFAYLTDADHAVNRFTVGAVDIVLDEPHFDPEAAKNLEPGAVVAKDPLIRNTGSNAAYVYLKISVPKDTIRTTNPDGSVNAAALVELLSYTANTGWTLFHTDTTTSTTENYYYYQYDAVLAVGASTGTLFDSVTLVNFVEGDIAGGTELEMDIDAYAIQSDIDGITGPADAWTLLNAQCNIIPVGP